VYVAYDYEKMHSCVRILKCERCSIEKQEVLIIVPTAIVQIIVLTLRVTMLVSITLLGCALIIYWLMATPLPVIPDLHLYNYIYVTCVIGYHLGVEREKWNYPCNVQ
jgi:hypothetical protein